RHVKLAFGAVTFFVMPVAVGVFFTGDAILTLLFEAKFALAATPLALMCLSMIPNAVIIIMGFYAMPILGFAAYACVCLLIGLAAGVAFALAADPAYGLAAIGVSVAVAKGVAALGIYG